jgi:hypothetical protein
MAEISARNTPVGFGAAAEVPVDSVSSPIVPQGAAEP